MPTDDKITLNDLTSAAECGACLWCGGPADWVHRLIVHRVGKLRVGHVAGIWRHGEGIQQKVKVLSWIKAWSV